MSDKLHIHRRIVCFASCHIRDRAQVIQKNRYHRRPRLTLLRANNSSIDSQESTSIMTARIEAPYPHPPCHHITLSHTLNIGNEPFPELAPYRWSIQAMQGTTGTYHSHRLLHYRKVLQDRGHHPRAALIRTAIERHWVRGRDRLSPSLRRVCSLHPRPVNITI